MADAVRTLTESLRHFGLDSLSSQPDLWRNTLRDRLSDQPREATLLTAALDAGIPARLSTESRSGDVATLLAQLARGLEHSHGLSTDSAQWAVQTWAQALDVPSTSISPQTAPQNRPTTQPPAAPVRQDATVLRPPPGDFTAPHRPSDHRTPAPTSGGPRTVLRAEPGPGSPPQAALPTSGGYRPPPGTNPSPPPGSPPPRRGAGGSGRRRLLALVGVIALIAIISGVTVFVLRDSGDGSASSYAPISRVLAHRGDHEGYPQETLPAFLQAARRGFTVETDVRWTKDGVPIINHDPTTGRGMVCSGGPYLVSETTWAVLHSRCRTPQSASKTNRSYGIPRFATVVEQLSRIHSATLFAELKVIQTAAENKKYLSIVRKAKMLPRTVATSYVSSYLQSFSKEVAREGVKIRTLRFAGADSPTTLADLKKTGVWGALFDQGWDRTAALISSARKADIHVGTITLADGDGPTQWATAKKLRAEYVLTDRPSAYHSWLAEH